MARYVLRASGATGPVEFQEPVTLEAALVKAQELQDAHFTHITIVNLRTGIEIADVEALIMRQGEASRDPR
jgi:hypothetical protein